MTTERHERQDPDFKVRLLGAYGRVADTAVLPLIAASLGLGWLAWRVFFHFAARLWARQFHMDTAMLNPWVLHQIADTDGAEPQALLGLVVVSTVLLGALAHLLPRASRRVRVFVTLASSCGALLLLRGAHFEIPFAEASPSEISAARAHYFAVAVVAVAASLVLGWGPQARRRLPVVTALLLIPLVFVPSALPSPGDAMAILSPALRLLRGVAPAHVYMQYDYLPSLIAEAWLWLGGDPMAIFLATSASYYALLVGLLLLVWRWFSHPGLRGPLLVAVVIVRVYGVELDHIAIPQIAPFRLDLWILPVAVAFYCGVRHWAVALVLGMLCISSRSIGMLYLGGYAMAFPADFLAARLALSKAERPSLRREWGDFWRSAAPNAAIIVGCLALATWLLGSPVSETVLLYRKLGIGQLKILRDSFYWWLLPLTALSGALAFWKRGEQGEKKGGAMLLTVALLISSSIYFFGRSHENNLDNLAVPFLLCFFLSLDLCLNELERGARATQLLPIVLSSLLIGLCAFAHRGRIWTKAVAQIAVLSRSEQSEPLFISRLGPMYCEEVAHSAPDGKVYFFGTIDFWYYQRCHYAPPSYQQPMGLSVLKAPLLAELGDLLDRGYTIALVKGDAMNDCFMHDFVAGLSVQRVLLNTQSEHYDFVTRGADRKKPARRRQRPAHTIH